MEEASVKLARYFGAIIENRDYIMTQHARRVGMISYVIADKLRGTFPEYGLDGHMVRMISSAATLHDVGKLKIPDRITEKPTRLTPNEYEMYQNHSYIGSKMFKDVASRMPKDDPDREFFKFCAEVCMCHHERYDGEGYPEGLKGDEIPISAQIVGLADAYDELVSPRIHKKPYSKLEAFEMIMNGEKGSFSPKLLEVFRLVRSELEQIIADEDK